MTFSIKAFSVITLVMTFSIIALSVKKFSIMVLSVLLFSIMTFSIMIFSVLVIQHNFTQYYGTEHNDKNMQLSA